MQEIIVRYRAAEDANVPSFSARNFRALSLESLGAENIPDGFAEISLSATGATLAQAVYLSGRFKTPALCSGLGRCGLCRVRFISEAPNACNAEKTVLSHHDLDAGWRLACRHAPRGGMRVLVPAPPMPALAEPVRSPENLVPAGLAVDLGTTSIHWRFMVPGNADAPRGVMTNPQMGAGSDVVSRLAYASSEEGAAALRRLVTDALRRVVLTGEERGFATQSLCVAANPSMMAIFLGQDTRALSHAPYTLPDKGGRIENVLGLPPVYVPPHIAPFVGADASAGYAALALDPEKPAPDYPFLLADLGTNGECVLALSPDTALAASVPMGPALEGINLTYGSEAVPGAVTEYALTPFGLEPKILGDTAPTGITATGYLSLLRILRASHLITEHGLFARPKDALGERIGGGTRPEADASIRLPGKMLLFASDVEEILKVKAAFTLAVSRLLARAGLRAAGLKRVYLAGSLGGHVSVNALTDLGFLPSALADRVVFAGNTALEGAALLLREESARAALNAWAENAIPLDLAADPAFAAAFADHMVFSWKG